MEIKTKYNIGDFLYTIKDNKVYHFRVEFIQIIISESEYSDMANHYHISYRINNSKDWYNELDCTKEKEKLLQILLNK